VRLILHPVTIETPEHIELQFLPAGIGTRFLAYLVDRFIQAILIAGLLLMIVLWLVALERLVPVIDPVIRMGKSLGQWTIAAAILVYGCISMGYFILFEYLWNGATPGKRSQYIRVIRADGRPLSLFDSAVRNILRFVDILGDIYPLGLVVMFLDPRHRRLGDLTAGTFVVVDNRVEKPTVQELSADIRGLDPDVRWVVTQMTPKDYLLVTKFLERREGMDVLHREAVAKTIGDRLFARAGRTADPKSDPETILEDAEMLYREKTRIL
jgi:uncharacterized RDD family membrane protein YckC